MSFYSTNSHLLEKNVNIDFGLNSPLLKQSILNSREILFHAAIYSNFADAEIGNLIKQQIELSILKKVTLVATDFTLLSKDDDWRYEFMSMLRHDISYDEFEKLKQVSITWSEALRSSFPHKVNLIYSRQLPTQPILLFDNALWVGSYSHCHYQANQGVWLRFSLSSVFKNESVVFKWLYHGFKDGQFDSENMKDIALYRYISDCRQALGLSL